MFGQDDTSDTQTQNSTVQPTATDDTANTGAPEVKVDIPDDDSNNPTPAAPAISDTPSGADVSPVADDTAASSAPTGDATSEITPSDSTGALMEIKRSALQELSPLLDELSQPPEEKFRTTMMMIQAFDDKKLIGKAYEAAKAIKDRKERAEALLDIVNEINYFTQDAGDKEEN